MSVLGLLSAKLPESSESRKSYRWYRTQIDSLGRNINARDVMGGEKLTNNLIVGNMYLFMYDPKHKDTLPYYDIFPLVLPFRRMPDGFLGINLHYLPYLARYKLLGELGRLAIDQNMNNNTRIRISWELLSNSSRYLAATACVKHYLSEHLKSRFMKINYPDWTTAAMLPIEGFRKSPKERVWRDTRKKVPYV